jgi:hypothetical protein
MLLLPGPQDTPATPRAHLHDRRHAGRHEAQVLAAHHHVGGVQQRGQRAQRVAPPQHVLPPAAQVESDEQLGT